MRKYEETQIEVAPQFYSGQHKKKNVVVNVVKFRSEKVKSFTSSFCFVIREQYIFDYVKASSLAAKTLVSAVKL